MLMERIKAMRTWTMRILGAFNLAFGAVSLSYLAGMLSMHWHKWPASAARSDWVLFVILLSLNIYLTIHLGYCGIRLIRRDDNALVPACALFAAQILCCLLNFVIVWLILPLSMGSITFGFWDVALSGLDLQVLSGYAPVGFVVTLILLASRRKAIIANLDAPNAAEMNETKS
jgi:hypothetical protein